MIELDPRDRLQRFDDILSSSFFTKRAIGFGIILMGCLGVIAALSFPHRTKSESPLLKQFLKQNDFHISVATGTACPRRASLSTIGPTMIHVADDARSAAVTTSLEAPLEADELAVGMISCEMFKVQSPGASRLINAGRRPFRRLAVLSAYGGGGWFEKRRCPSAGRGCGAKRTCMGVRLRPRRSWMTPNRH